MSSLCVDSLSVRYGDDVAVDNVSFSIDAGDSVGLVGESGSGKTQIALSILGLLPRNATVRGSIVFDGVELQGASEQHISAS